MNEFDKVNGQSCFFLRWISLKGHLDGVPDGQNTDRKAE